MNEFLLKLVQAQFDLQILETNTPLVAPLPVQQPLLRQWIIDSSRERILLQTNETTRHESIVGQMLISLAVDLDRSLWLSYPFEVDPIAGLVGECDYLVSRSSLTFRIHPPVVLIVEVKRTLERCLSHCLVELAAAAQFNGDGEPVYGVLTTGLEWQFLKLQGKVVTVEQSIYPLDPIEQVAGI